MKAWDVLRFTLQAVEGAKTRSILMLIAMAIGVAAVVMLTALGEGARRYVTNEFASMGSNILIVMPGRSETSGVNPSLFLGQTPRDLTINDALALTHSIHVKQVSPIALGSASVSSGAREREVPVIGTTANFQNVRSLEMAQGRFLPKLEPDQAMAVTVIGAELKRELFGGKRALGEWVRIGDRRFRVVGVLSDEGQSLGMDFGDMAIVPVASAQMLYNTTNLPRIFVETKSVEVLDQASEDIIRILRERHQGEEDVTVMSQNAMLSTFDNVLQALTLTVGGIAAISLAVAGILIMNVMLVAVSQRTTEVGLLKALGATPRQIQILFLMEASFLSFIGAMFGLAVGLAATWFGRNAFPEVPFAPPTWAVLAALAVALLTGIIFGVMPARRAAQLDPVDALARGKV